MTQLDRFHIGDNNLVCKLNKALYGFKQAPKAWFEKLHCTLTAMGFYVAKCDTVFFNKVTPTSTIHVLIYIDDVIITVSSSTAITNLINSLHHTSSLFPQGYWTLALLFGN